jgi:hypothetical protein
MFLPSTHPQGPPSTAPTDSPWPPFPASSHGCRHPAQPLHPLLPVAHDAFQSRVEQREKRMGHVVGHGTFGCTRGEAQSQSKGHQDKGRRYRYSACQRRIRGWYARCTDRKRDADGVATHVRYRGGGFRRPMLPGRGMGRRRDVVMSGVRGRGQKERTYDGRIRVWVRLRSRGTTSKRTRTADITDMIRAIISLASSSMLKCYSYTHLFRSSERTEYASVTAWNLPFASVEGFTSG